jgi:hypothetical protein
MLLNIPSNQPRITTTVPTHCSLTSSYQGHDQDESNDDEEQVNEDNIDDSQQRTQSNNEQGEQDEEDAPSHTYDVGSTDIAIPSLTKKKLKHGSSSSPSTFHSTLIPRSSSTLTTTSATVMLRHQHQHRRPRHDTYRTLQLPVNSTNKLLIVTPNSQYRPSLTSTAGSENNLQSTGTHRHNGMYHQHPNSNSCFDEETVRTLSRGKLICLGA